MLRARKSPASTDPRNVHPEQLLTPGAAHRESSCREVPSLQCPPMGSRNQDVPPMLPSVSPLHPLTQNPEEIFMASDRNDKPLASLFSDLTRNIVDLVRQEIALARAEVSQKISNAQGGLTELAIGAAILLAGLFIILQAIVNAVAMLLPPNLAPWLAPLIVGV